MLYIALAIVLYPFLTRMSYRLFPVPNRQLEVMNRVLEKVAPVLEHLMRPDRFGMASRAIALEDAPPEVVEAITERLQLCGVGHEAFDPKLDGMKSHWCVKPRGHDGDEHQCSCGTTWTATVTE